MKASLTFRASQVWGGAPLGDLAIGFDSLRSASRCRVSARTSFRRPRNVESVRNLGKSNWVKWFRHQFAAVIRHDEESRTGKSAVPSRKNKRGAVGRPTGIFVVRLGVVAVLPFDVVPCEPSHTFIVEVQRPNLFVSSETAVVKGSREKKAPAVRRPIGARRTPFGRGDESDVASVGITKSDEPLEAASAPRFEFRSACRPANIRAGGRYIRG